MLHLAGRGGRRRHPQLVERRGRRHIRGRGREGGRRARPARSSPVSSSSLPRTPTLARTIGRRMITAYLNVEAYAEFHRWLGRGPALQPMWDAWAAGDRKGALAAIPDDVVDELVVHGSVAECRAHIQRYVDNGDHHPGARRRPDRRRVGRGRGGLSPPRITSGQAARQRRLARPWTSGGSMGRRQRQWQRSTSAPRRLPSSPGRCGRRRSAPGS